MATEAVLRTHVSGAVHGVVFVTTPGNGSLNLYSRKLAEQLPAEEVATAVHQCVGERFGVGLLTRSSLTSLRGDIAFVRRLREPDAVLLHLPNHHLARYGPFLGRPYLVTVHDLIRYFDLNGLGPFIHPPNARDRIYPRLDYAGIRRATALIAVSETTKRDLCVHLGIPEERVFVVYQGVDHGVFRPLSGRPLDAPYLLFVGSEQPRKDLPTALRAFAALKREARSEI